MQDIRFKEDLLIMGNQAADLDSSVSAIAFASLLKKVNPERSIYPLIQGSPSDLRLKPEIKSLFLKAEISLKPENFTSFFFNQDSLLLNSDSLEKAAVIMVDHNKTDTEEITHPVRGIVDHHIDSGLSLDLKLRDIRICGSCASIISEYWQQSAEEIPYGITLLLAGAIAVDTGYLDPSWGKTTELDRRQYEALSKTLMPEDRSFIDELLNIKNDLSHLSMDEQLKRDYKDFPMENLKGGISSVPLGQKTFFSSAFYKDESVSDFSRRNCPDFLIIMHTVPEPFKRELSLYTDNSSNELSGILKTALNLLKDPGLKIIRPESRISISTNKWTLYSQKNIKISRKVLVPLLKEELETLINNKT